ncbi:MAG: MarR family transcriptional regulator [Pseudomonadota bacterium]
MPGPSRLSLPAALDDLLLYRINRLLAVGGSPIIRLCEGHYGITRREWRVIALLAQNEGLMSSQLALRAQLDRARTSKAVTSLVAKRLLSRVPGPGDRRQARLALTAQGRALYEDLFPRVQAINQQLLSALSPDDAARLDVMLDRLQQCADVALPGQEALPKADRRRGIRARQVPG